MHALANAIFRRGPAWLGGWEGKPAHDVCAALSGTASDLWVRNPGECGNLIAARLEAWTIGAQCVGALLLAYCCKGLATEWIRRPGHTTIVLSAGQADRLAVFEHAGHVTGSAPQRASLPPQNVYKE